jgi:hypothetical protein
MLHPRHEAVWFEEKRKKKRKKLDILTTTTQEQEWPCDSKVKFSFSRNCIFIWSRLALARRRLAKNTATFYKWKIWKNPPHRSWTETEEKKKK